MKDLTDEQLLAVLGDALRMAEPVPEAVRDMARGALTWRTVDAELAAITSDSAVEGLVGVRGTSVARTVLFTAGEVEVELTVASTTTDAGGRSRLALTGQVVPETAAVRVRIQHREGETLVTSDDFGAFEATDVPRGPARLLLDLPDGPVVTEAVTL